VTVEGEDTAAAAEEERLRYLEFVQRAAAQALVLAAVSVDHVEGTVVGRFHLLRLLDRKVRVPACLLLCLYRFSIIISIN
jgi:hypothetical protein